MKFKVLKQSHLKRNFLIGIAIMLILTAVILTFTKTKYRVTESIPLVNGTINYDLADLNAVAVYIQEGNDYSKSDTIPSSGYTFNEEESYCTVNGEEDTSITVSYDANTQSLSVSPLTTQGTKCYLYFDEQRTLLKDTILANNEINSETPNFSKTAQANCSDTNTCEETNGLYSESTNNGTTYYFRGTVDNNWVQFGGYYWRVIRINENGSIRVIYNGTNTTQTGSTTQINDIYTFSNLETDNMYVGYMYESNNKHGFVNDSYIKTVIDSWYESSGLSNYSKYLDGNAGFCGDRTAYANNTGTTIGGGTGTTPTYYGTYIRLYNSNSISNVLPSFECENSDLYTTNGGSNGNGALQYPIGLITADEVAYAGGVYGTNNTSYYLYTRSAYWTMSPSYFNFNTFGYTAYVFYVYSNGYLSSTSVFGTFTYRSGIRPVINLNSDVAISSGDGTSSNPYIIAT